MKSFKTYTLGACAYSCIRKCAQIRKATKEEYCYKEKKYINTPIFLGTKIVIISASIIYAPLLFPMWLITDVNNFDALLNNHADMIIQPSNEFEYFIF